VIVNDTLRDHEKNVSDTELKDKYAAAVKEGDYSRLVVYAGTGSGLITKRQTAKEILDEIEGDLDKELKTLNDRVKSLQV
jgi:NAD(P)H-dependent flavin oxidoreductase YrpB (nitropropane dioxygenase family)